MTTPPDPVVEPSGAPDVPALVSAFRARTPGAVAVADGATAATYAELDHAARGYAALLRRNGIGPEDVVAVVAERGLRYITMVLGVLRAGAAFLPVEPGLPPARAAQMCRRGAVRAALSEPAHRGLAERLGVPVMLETVLDDGGSAVRADPANLAYLIFTSGSTGVPKGAMVTAGGLANHTAAKIHDLALGPGDRVGFTAPLSFDISVWQALTPLAAGATVCIAQTADLAEPAALLAWVRRHGVTVLEIVPSFLALVLDTLAAAPQPLPTLRTVVSTGEALPGSLARRWHEHGPGAVLINAYGPTECSDDVTHHVVTRADAESQAWPPIGAEIRNTRLYVVDADGRELPRGVVGGLWVGGAGVGRGYAGDPRGTALAFVPDALSGRTGLRLYRTGDRGARAVDGTLSYAGRTDRQVKLRGYRIELGDVEAGLLSLPAVTAAACIVADDRLRAFVTLADRGRRSGRNPGAWLLSALRDVLPRHLVPHDVTVLDRLPTAATGKVDHRALAAHRDGFRTAPETGHDDLAQVCALVAEVVGTGPVGPEDDLFAIGGDSLKAMSVIAVGRRRFDAEGASLAAFLADPTPRGLLAVLRDTAPSPADGAEPAVGKLSSGQERLWFLERLHPGRPRQLIRLPLTLRGPLDRDALRNALAAVVARHETLRMTFAADRGVPVARVWPTATPVLEVVTGGDPVAEAEAEAGLSADTTPPPLLRARLAATGPNEHVLTLVLHHLVADGFSLGVLGRELCENYARYVAGDATAKPADASFTAYVRAERTWLAGDEGAACERFWADRLDGAPPVIELPWDHPRRDAPDFTAGHAVRELTEDRTLAVSALARELRATPFMVAVAALYHVLRGLAGTDDIVVGIDSANRSWPGSERLIGNFVNQLPLRLRAPDTSLRGLVEHARAECLAAYAHDRLPFHHIVAAVNPPRRLGRFPLFQVKASHQGSWRQGLALPGVEVIPGEIAEPATDLDLMLEVSGEASRLRLEMVYRRELLDSATAESWLEATARALAVGTVTTRRDGAGAGTATVGQTRAAKPVARSRPPVAQPRRERPDRALTTTEAVVAGLWCELLDLDAVAAADNFFEIGGHSLAASQAVYELAGRTGADLELETFFELGTVEEVAAEIDRRRSAADDAASVALIDEGEL